MTKLLYVVYWLICHFMKILKLHKIGYRQLWNSRGISLLNNLYAIPGDATSSNVRNFRIVKYPSVKLMVSSWSMYDMIVYRQLSMVKVSKVSSFTLVLLQNTAPHCQIYCLLFWYDLLYAALFCNLPNFRIFCYTGYMCC